ncbi:MAG: pitrilysin family protein [Candidatus Aminicenantes bacterium]|nr:pitrilysin family protein [Candidatus Aminicenantes bacterium]
MKLLIVRDRSAVPDACFWLAAALGLILAGPAGAQERFRRTPPLPDAQRLELKLPAVETTVLANGLTVATARRPGSPVVTLQLVIRAGEADSPPDRPGLAALTARMIGKGTRQLSADYIENMIESLGAVFKASVFMDYTVLTMDVLAEYLDRAVYVLRLITLEATFGERELGAVRRAAFWELYESKKDPEVLGWRQLLAVLFEKHPYRLATQNEDVIKFITPRDVADFYGRFYRPANAAVLVSGDVDGPAIAQKIGSHFSAWSGAAPAQAPPPPPAANDRERICYVEAPEAGAATIFAGNVIMASSAPDFFPFLVLKQILGGTTGSRLFMSLRETKGLATFAFSEMEVFRSCGVYWARAQVRPEAIVPAVRETERVIGGLAAGPPPPFEVEEAKSYLIGSLPLRFESAEGFAEWMARYVALGLGQAQWDGGTEAIKQVNAEMVGETARKYLSARPVVIVVGRPEWIGPYLGGLEPVEIYDASGQLKSTTRKQGEGR